MPQSMRGRAAGVERKRTNPRYDRGVTRLDLILASFILAALGAPGHAAEVPCHFDAGVIVVPAEVAGIAGDYILDTGSARTMLHETLAQTAGIEATEILGDVVLAGHRTMGLPLTIVDLDVRTWNLPTVGAGVIGADVLRDFVVDVSFAPCRVRLSSREDAPSFRGRSLGMGWDQGRPTVMASISDDARQITGTFVVATGANAPIRLADDLAGPEPGASPELYPQGVWLARLPQVRFAGRTGRDVAAGLMKPDGDIVGVLGAALLANFRLRFDFPAGRLIVAPSR